MFNPYKINNQSLDAEIEIFKSDQTITDSIVSLKNILPREQIPSFSDIRGGLKLSSSNSSLISISLSHDDKELTPMILDQLVKEYMIDRKEFRKESSAAAREFISKELPKVRLLLSEAEDNLNSFKLSTNSVDIIFDDKTRNTKLNELQERIDEINFKELELKEFYKSNHPIYVTLSQQKDLVLSKIKEIEDELPEIPNRQRKIENLKREVKIYSDVIQNLSSEDINLSMIEASSLSNVRVINKASIASKISPNFMVIPIFPILMVILFFIIQALRYFSSDTISNPDALIDFVGKKRVIGELPLLDVISKKEKTSITNEMADELLHRTIFEITHSGKDFSSILFTSSRKNVGKTEVSERVFKMLIEEGKKTCLIDLDYRQGSLSKNRVENEKRYTSFEDFYKDKEKFINEDSLFIPSFKVESIPAFFKSEEFKDSISKLKDEYDYLLCDTPPWSLFVDAKIINEVFEKIIYVAGSDISTFKDIRSFEDETKREDSIFYFFNKFNYFYNFLGLQYQYPYYSNNYYYDYEGYRNIRKKVNISTFFGEIYNKILKLFKK